VLAFEQPAWFLLLVLLVPGVWLRHFRSRRGATVSVALSNWNGERFTPPLTWQASLNAVLHVLFWLGCVSLVAALAGPAWVTRDRVFVSRGSDIMVVIDCSPSMAAQDFGGKSRLDRARDTVRAFVAKRENDPVGLVAFASEAVTQVPPTLDYPAVGEGLDGLRAMEYGEGTAIGLGLTLAAAHLRDSSASRKVIILVTDGENNEGEISPETAVGLIAGEGIVLYTVGIGSSGEAPLEYVDPSSGKIFRGTYKGQFGGQLLAAMAAKTGGQYFAALAPGALESGFQVIDSREKIETRSTTETNIRSLAGLLVAFALLAIVLDAMLRRLVLKEIT
jgi:Ca-activated chloride channel family protein